MTDETVLKIRGILKKCIEGALMRTQKKKSFRPFHTALLTEELVNVSAFERSFSTSFGQGPIEEISNLIAIENGYETKRQKDTLVNVFKGAIDEIERTLSSLRGGEKKPNWTQEVNKINAYKKGDTVVRRVISDLWIKKNDIETYISIKTVKPNLDQTEKAKKDMLLLKADDENHQVFFGLFYNPGGEERADYNWNVPSKIFDMKNDPCVLIGKDYWNYLGGEGTYDDLIDVFEAVGNETREQIKNL
ncbi:MAG: TdeIII family type II restriction endonuclease [Bacteroidetes bacterium]|jgi:hypothetical protein|nr:TdeIII family type II restriction endonuclease [Bacteroidota bacterium]MDF1863350.1 TdeIII family type II restriction endonuclease [Saprospiraceae bacterium]